MFFVMLYFLLNTVVIGMGPTQQNADGILFELHKVHITDFMLNDLSKEQTRLLSKFPRHN